MQRPTGAGVSEPRPEGTEETFGQRIIGVLRPRPPDQCGDDHEIGRDIGTIGYARSEGGKQQPAGRRTDRPGNVDAKRIEGDSAFDVLALNQLRNDCLPGRPHQRGADPAEKCKPDQRADREHSGLCQDHKRDADGCQ
ncbi:hypothetical protein D3C71_1678420 [compost metagenome]